VSEEILDAVRCGDAFDELPQLPENSVHAVVTDPPYGLAFMGRDWDDFEPNEYQTWCEEWAGEVRRVLKPGGHVLAFSGNRTHHRLFAGLEDAGLTIRDTLTWHYGSGFPKALDVAKAIDEAADVDREVVGTETVDVGMQGGSMHAGREQEVVERDKTVATTDAAKRWDGWRTGLKPATEFIVLAREPFEGTVAENVQQHGTGALNIDGCRVELSGKETKPQFDRTDIGEVGNTYSPKPKEGTTRSGDSTEGRYPANVIFDEVAAYALDRRGEAPEGSWPAERPGAIGYGGESTGQDGLEERTDTPDGPSSYFYTSKASRAERTLNGRIANPHPTVKPPDLMEWLVRLVTREGQVVLDPFAGSGTTLAAAKELGRRFIGIERQPRWADVARVRAGLTPADPSHVRDDDGQAGLEAFADGGDGV
jgi:DNA modification methylase